MQTQPMDPNITSLIQLLQQQVNQQQQQTNMLVSAITNSKAQRPPSLPPIRGDRRLEDDLKRFEQHMTAFRVPQERWSTELRMILQDDALAAFLALPTSQANNYDAIKTALLVRAGISATSSIQALLQLNPKFGATAAQFYGSTKDALTSFASGMSLSDFIDHLALEMTYKVATPHISAFVRALHRPKSHQSVCELDEYVVSRSMDHDKLWRRSTPRQHPSEHVQYQSMSRSNPQKQHFSDPTPIPQSQNQPRSQQITPNTPITTPTSKPRFVKQPHKLAKYFHPVEGPLCFQCEKWGHQARECPERAVCSLSSVQPNDNRVFCMGKIKDQIVRIFVDEGSQETLVNANLIPEPPGNTLTVTVESPWKSRKTMAQVSITLTAFDETCTFDALVCPEYNGDVLLGTNCPKFLTIRDCARQQMTHVCAATTRQQETTDLQTQRNAEQDQENNGVAPTPLEEIVGEEYDFPQTNMSLQITSEYQDDHFLKDTESLAKDQRSDISLQDLQKEAEDQTSDFVIISNVLHRKTTDQDGQAYTQIVLPHNRRAEVMRLAHSTPMAGHIGARRTKYKIMRNFFWPNITKDVKAYCRSCERCQKTAKKDHRLAPLQTTPTFTTPFKRVALDVVGPLPLTTRKNMFILTYIDMASRYPDAVPLRVTTSKAIAEAVLQIFCRLSIPEEILTDRGPNFVSTFMKEVYHFLGIQHLKTAPYRPQTNGCLERYHHSLMQMVRKSIADQKDWDVYLPYLLFACREVPSSSTGYSPFELLYGKEVHGPLDVLRQQWVPTSKTPRDATEWLVQLRDSLDAMRATAAENQSKAKTYSKTYHDKTAKDRQFKIGDKVLVFSPVVTGKRNDKLSDRWQGPYTIFGQVTPVTYMVDMQERNKKHRTVHLMP